MGGIKRLGGEKKKMERKMKIMATVLVAVVVIAVPTMVTDVASEKNDALMTSVTDHLFTYTITATGTETKTTYPEQSFSATVYVSVQETYRKYEYVQNPYPWCYYCVNCPSTYLGLPLYKAWHPGGDGSCGCDGKTYSDDTSQWYCFYQRDLGTSTDYRTETRSFSGNVNGLEHSCKYGAEIDLGQAVSPPITPIHNKNNDKGWPIEVSKQMTFSLTVSDSNPYVEVFFTNPWGSTTTTDPSAHLMACTDHSETQTIDWSDTEEGSSTVTAEEGKKHITTSTLIAPNKDTKWCVICDNPRVHCGMVENKLYAEVIVNKPTAYIDSITPNPATQGDTINFTGHGTDSDGKIVGYSWESSIDEELSDTSSFTKSDLSVGTHTIYFKVKDDDGAWSTEVNEDLTINPANPTVSIFTDKYEYTAGEKMHLGLDVKNPLDSAQNVGIDVWLEMPAYPWAYTLIHMPSINLPAGLDYSNPDFKVFKLPPIDSGTYTWYAQLSDPITGEIICEDSAEWVFVFRGAPTGDITEVLEQTTVVIDFAD